MHTDCIPCLFRALTGISVKPVGMALFGTGSRQTPPELQPSCCADRGGRIRDPYPPKKCPAWGAGQTWGSCETCEGVVRRTATVSCSNPPQSLTIRKRDPASE